MSRPFRLAANCYRGGSGVGGRIDAAEVAVSCGPGPRSGSPERFHPRNGNFGTKSGRKPHQIATSAQIPHQIATSALAPSVSAREVATLCSSAREVAILGRNRTENRTRLPPRHRFRTRLPPRRQNRTGLPPRPGNGTKLPPRAPPGFVFGKSDAAGSNPASHPTSGAPNLGRAGPRAHRPSSHPNDPLPQSAIVGRPRILEAWNTAIVRSRS
jgi:hypothetical protein